MDRKTPAVSASWLSWCRFSIRALLLWMTLIAIGIWSLRNASTGWASIAFWTCVIVLTGALLNAVNESGERRAWWAGFGICGWIYLLLVPCEIARPELGFSSMFDHGNLPTSRWSERLYWAIYPTGGTTFRGEGASFYLGNMQTGGVRTDSQQATPQSQFAIGAGAPAVADFVAIAQLHWTMVVAAIGGWASWIMFHQGRRNERSASPAARA
jgi:hypothetical protein